MRSPLGWLLVACSGFLAACDDASTGSAADAAADVAAAPAEVGADATPDLLASFDAPASAIDSAPDGAPDVPAICRVDASFLPGLQIPGAGGGGGDAGAGDGGGDAGGDAGGGDGGAGLAACLPCVASNCRDSITACVDSCDCRVAFAEFAECMARGTAALECAGALARLPPDVARLAQAPLLCAFAACGRECGLTPGN